jgi:hypothetical protein
MPLSTDGNKNHKYQSALWKCKFGSLNLC